MFDHEHRVAPGFEFLQRGQQLLVVTRVEADGGLVQDVEHAAQVRAQLGRQSNPLRLAARQCRHASAKLEVTQADLAQELKALPNLGQDVAGDSSGAAFEPEFAEETVSLFNRH